MSTPTTNDGCGCGEHVRAGMTRRGVLRGLGLLAGAAAASPLLSSRLAFAADPSSTTNTLVVLSMRGGWDGLSVVPPVGDPDYAKLRPNIGIPASLAVPLGGLFGLHPGLAGLKPLYDAGQLAVVHAVGQPSGTRSHFQDSEELERAAPGTSLRTGWLDRVLGVQGAGTTFQAVQLGSTSLPESLVGPAPALTMSSVDSFKLSVWSGVQPQFQNALTSMYQGSNSPAAAGASDALTALSTAAQLTAAGYTPANGASYPTSALGKALQDLARLVKANVGLQYVTLDYGNWDMHVGLGKPGDANGWMHRQLLDVAACLAAFAKDLGNSLSKVTVVTLTEFGRRAAENGSGGVDHGHGQAVLVFGGGVRGGQVYGQWPGLSSSALDNGDLAGVTDYRSILGELLQKRSGVGSLSDVFPGFTPSPLGLATTS